MAMQSKVSYTLLCCNASRRAKSERAAWWATPNQRRLMPTESPRHCLRSPMPRQTNRRVQIFRILRRADFDASVRVEDFDRKRVRLRSSPQSRVPRKARCLGQTQPRPDWPKHAVALIFPGMRSKNIKGNQRNKDDQGIKWTKDLTKACGTSKFKCANCMLPSVPSVPSSPFRSLETTSARRSRQNSFGKDDASDHANVLSSWEAKMAKAAERLGCSSLTSLTRCQIYTNFITNSHGFIQVMIHRSSACLCPFAIETRLNITRIVRCL